MYVALAAAAAAKPAPALAPAATAALASLNEAAQEEFEWRTVAIAVAALDGPPQSVIGEHTLIVVGDVAEQQVAHLRGRGIGALAVLLPWAIGAMRLLLHGPTRLQPPRDRVACVEQQVAHQVTLSHGHARVGREEEAERLP